jgi:hypothetical protein
MTDTTPQPTAPVDQLTKFYGEGEEYVSATGVRYRLVKGEWVIVEAPA